MLLRTLAVSALSATFLIAVPQPDAHAGRAGKIIGGVAAGAAAGYIAHKVYKKHKKKKYHGTKKTYTSTKSSGPKYSESTYDTQVRLNALGYDAGAPDGLSGRKTRQAIREFQITNGGTATGKLSNAQIAILHQQSDKVFAARNPNAAGSSTVAAAPAAVAPVAVAPAAAGLATAYADDPGPAPQSEPLQPAKPLKVVAPDPASPGLETADNAAPYSTLADRPAILGLTVGGSLNDAQAALQEGGFENCDTYDNALFCERKTSLGSDKIAVAASGKKIHTITRKMSFDQAIEAKTIFDRMPETYGHLLNASDKTVAASPACGALLAAKADTFDNVVKQSVDGNPFDATTVGFSHACSYYFAINTADTPTVKELELTFFDAQPILANTKGGVRQVSSGDKKTDDAIKF